MWNDVQTEETIDQLVAASFEKPVLLYKHSTRCSLSHMVKDRLDQDLGKIINSGIEVYYLDLIRFRKVSNYVEKKLGVRHESPQVILLKEGKVVNHESHTRINATQIMEWAA